MKYLVDATVIITLEDVPINLDNPAQEELELHDALLQKLNARLVLLDIKGGRTGDDGLITEMECDAINRWEVCE